MKTAIHPKYVTDARATCACGAGFVVDSTEEKIALEICSNCHPFFTGNTKILDTAGRVEKFQARRKAAAKASPTKSHSAKARK